MSQVKKIAIWTRYPEWVRAARIRVMHGAGIPEERYPVGLRRLLMLAYRNRLSGISRE